MATTNIPSGAVGGDTTIEADVRLVDDAGAAVAFNEDAAHTTGDAGVMALAVRSDVVASKAGTDGDYQPPITDALGKLYVNPLSRGYNTSEHVTVSSAGTAVEASSILTVQYSGYIFIKANAANTGAIYYGNATVDSASGLVIAPGEMVGPFPAYDSDVWFDADVSGDGVSVIAWRVAASM